ncbi:hypothetical protein GCM10028828_07070 [Corynebacterium tapiri]
MVLTAHREAPEQLAKNVPGAQLNDNVFAVEVDGISVFLAPVQREYSNEDVLNNIHPVFTSEDEMQAIAEHEGHLIVTAASFADTPAARLDVARAHQKVLKTLARSEQVVAYYREGTTFGPAALQQAVQEDPPVRLSCPVWVWQGEEGVTAYTFGLHEWGLPELQVVDSQASPVEVMAHIEDLAGLLLVGGAVPDNLVEKQSRWLVAEADALNLSL